MTEEIKELSLKHRATPYHDDSHRSVSPVIVFPLIYRANTRRQSRRERANASGYAIARAARYASSPRVGNNKLYSVMSSVGCEM